MLVWPFAFIVDFWPEWRQQLNTDDIIIIFFLFIASNQIERTAEHSAQAKVRLLHLVYCETNSANSVGLVRSTRDTRMKFRAIKHTHRRRCTSARTNDESHRKKSRASVQSNESNRNPYAFSTSASWTEFALNRSTIQNENCKIQYLSLLCNAFICHYLISRRSSFFRSSFFFWSAGASS